jgi:hypothetical protein
MALSRPGDRSRVFAVGAVLAMLLAACGETAAPQATKSPPLEATTSTVATPEPTRSPEQTPEPTLKAAASLVANTFGSPNYKYALTLPPGTAYLAWHEADRPWDGQAKVDMLGPYTERNTVAEGGLFLVGSPGASLDEFFGRFEANGTRYHGCGPAEDRLETTIGGTPAIAFTQVCENDSTFGRIALFNAGYGVGAYIFTTPGKELSVRDRLIELLSGLEWRTG